MTRSNALIKKLLPRHNKILDLCLAGYSLAFIAAQVDITVTQLRNIRESPSFQLEYSRRRENIELQVDSQIVENEIGASEILKNASAHAATKITTLIDSGDDAIAFRSAADVLDRSGHPKVAASIGANVGVITVLNTADVERLASTLELDRDPVKVVEAEIVGDKK